MLQIVVCQWDLTKPANYYLLSGSDPIVLLIRRVIL